jgi:drug/metabolite transporter (DMT)-like permease
MTGIFVRWAKAPGTVTAAYRMSISALVLLPFFLKKETAHAPHGRRWLLFVLLGGIFVAGDHGFLNTAVGLTRIANSTLLNNTAPLWVALFALLVWKERLTRTFWLGLATALTGAAVILGTDLLSHPQFGLGDVLALISSFFYAAYFLNTQRSREKISTLRYLFLVNIVSGALLFAFNLINGIPVTGYPLNTYLVFLAIGVFSHTIGYFCITYALGHLPASSVAPTMIAQLVLTSLLAIPLAGESLSLPQILGGVAVLAGIFLVNQTNREEARIEAVPNSMP